MDTTNGSEQRRSLRIAALASEEAEGDLLSFEAVSEEVQAEGDGRRRSGRKKQTQESDKPMVLAHRPAKESGASLTVKGKVVCVYDTIWTMMDAGKIEVYSGYQGESLTFKEVPSENETEPSTYKAIYRVDYQDRLLFKAVYSMLFLYSDVPEAVLWDEN